MEFSCQVCLDCYDSEDHRPLLLPACGHTFCAFCVQLLGQQGKTSCPKCRKDKAVQPVSSLPVNYSLLDIVQSKLSGAAAEEPPSSPTEETAGGKRPPFFSFPDSLPEPSSSPRRLICRRLKQSRIKQDASQPCSLRGHPKYTLASGPALTAVSPSASGNAALPMPARRTMQAHNPSSIQTGSERELQDELDFQMAVHLTFCKDQNHDLNQHTSCPVWRKQNEDNEDLTTAIALMQQI